MSQEKRVEALEEKRESRLPRCLSSDVLSWLCDDDLDALIELRPIVLQPDKWTDEQRALFKRWESACSLAAGVVIYDADDPGAAPSGGTVYLPDNGRD